MWEDGGWPAGGTAGSRAAASLRGSRSLEAAVRLLLPLLALLAIPPAVRAQRLTPPAFPRLEVAPAPRAPLAALGPGKPSDDGEADTGTLVIGGILGGLGGLYAGALLGANLGGQNCEDCGLVEAFYGAAIGSALGISGGVHLANGRQGSFGRSALATLAISAGGILAATTTEEAAFLLAIPIGQIAAAVGIERKLQVD